MCMLKGSDSRTKDDAPQSGPSYSICKTSLTKFYHVVLHAHTWNCNKFLNRMFVSRIEVTYIPHLVTNQLKLCDFAFVSVHLHI